MLQPGRSVRTTIPRNVSGPWAQAIDCQGEGLVQLGRWYFRLNRSVFHRVPSGTPSRDSGVSPGNPQTQPKFGGGAGGDLVWIAREMHLSAG